jgi:pimeloyl-ACP methyl ester carboxylesterase
MKIHQRSETISVNGMDMYYEVHGEGRPLLILHGFTGSGAGLAELFNELAKAYQLIIPDLRSHGRSTNPAKQFTFMAMSKSKCSGNKRIILVKVLMI